MHILTDKDSAAYWRLFREWQRKLGLMDWRITQAPDSSKPNVMAFIDKFDWVQRQAKATLNRRWKATPITKHTLEQTAVHELLHVMLHELVEKAQTPGVSADDLASVEHSIINRLELLLVPGEGQQ